MGSRSNPEVVKKPAALAGSRRWLLQGLAGSSLTLLAPRSGVSQEPQRSNERAGLELVSPETKSSIQRGLSALARRQITSGDMKGAFGTAGYAGGVAVCGLAGMAFLASGSAPGRGPYGKAIERCIDYLVRNTDSNGYVSAQATGGQDRMYGHGFATLFLAEAYGMSLHSDQNDRLGEKLKAAVRLIIATQNDQGGWRYQPVKSDADLSITICQIMALRAARDAGLHVPNETRARCIDYVKKSHGADGSFSYTLGAGSRGGSFALASAGIVALNSAGIYDGKEVESALTYVWRQKPSGQISGGYFFYSHYYAAQAMWHAGGTYWSGWYPAIRDLLIRNQGGNGMWNDPGAGEELGTAMGLIILQLPYNYVPVFGEG
ncbi:MAG TPA: prenyltransferase/squalene oxidase repeat-containing protein [Caulifigura sp.]|nr:prenyltransferase/squalene oxidase repeat-containing protein [Caulifigura sp.]